MAETELVSLKSELDRLRRENELLREQLKLQSQQSQQHHQQQQQQRSIDEGASVNPTLPLPPLAEVTRLTKVLLFVLCVNVSQLQLIDCLLGIKGASREIWKTPADGSDQRSGSKEAAFDFGPSDRSWRTRFSCRSVSRWSWLRCVYIPTNTFIQQQSLMNLINHRHQVALVSLITTQ